MLTSLSVPFMAPDDIASVVFHLRSGLLVLERQKRLTASDLSVKTTLGVLHKEMQAKLEVADALPQWTGLESALLSQRMAN